MSKTFLMVGAAAVAMSAYGAPALAQDAEEDAEARQDVITVTARKKDETLLEAPVDRKSTRLNSSHPSRSRMPSSA